MKLIITVILALISNFAFAFEFKGIKLNSAVTQSEVTEKTNAICGKSIREGYLCSGQNTIAGGNAKLAIRLDDNNIVTVIYLKYEADNFENVKEALIKKFGSPQSTDKSFLQNAMGVTVEQFKLSWTKDNELMVLEKYSKSILEGNLTIMNDTEMGKAEKRIENKKNDL